MKLTVNISRIIQDENLSDIIKGKSTRVSKLWATFEMDVTDGCYSLPFNIGQSIRLTESSNPIYIGNGSEFVYDVVSKSWDIILPKSVFGMGSFDTLVPKIQKEDGYDKKFIYGKY